MTNTLFSTYSQGENRVTASILAVFERISFALVESLLQALCQESETSLLVFQNQPAGVASVPDAVVRASFAYWIETKTAPRRLQRSQVERHLQALDAQQFAKQQRLILLTPDTAPPPVVEEIGDPRLAWASFDNLVEAINALVRPGEDWVASSRPVPTERERELLRELVRFLISEELVGRGDQVLVLAARFGLDEYLKYGVYMCQPNRTFQPCTHVAFYAQGAVQPVVPHVLDSVEQVTLTGEGVQALPNLLPELRDRLLALVAQLEADRPDSRWGEDAKVLLLSGPGDADTLRLPQAITNDAVSAGGKSVAFVQGQRYVSLERLKAAPAKTSALVG